MDDSARRRLKVAIAESGKTAKGISQECGWPETYVSRVVSGKIKNPAPDRLYKICSLIGAEIGYILTGNRLDNNREQLLEDLSTAPDEIIEKVAQFVREKGISPK